MSEEKSPSIKLLESIDRSLKAILARLSAAAPDVASDDDLDGPYGDPEVRTDKVRDWTGPPMKGRRYSECPPEFLDLLVGFLEWQAKKADEKDDRTSSGKLVSEYRRADILRARGWAKRMRDGRAPMPTDDAQDSEGPSF